MPAQRYAALITIAGDGGESDYRMHVKRLTDSNEMHYVRKFRIHVE